MRAPSTQRPADEEQSPLRELRTLTFHVAQSVVDILVTEASVVVVVYRVDSDAASNRNPAASDKVFATAGIYKSWANIRRVAQVSADLGTSTTFPTRDFDPY